MVPKPMPLTVIELKKPLKLFTNSYLDHKPFIHKKGDSKCTN